MGVLPVLTQHLRLQYDFHGAIHIHHVRTEATPMNQNILLDSITESHGACDDCPLSVREAARYLGVSPQTVYLWVERKQIPHLRVMGRNIRFLKSDLEPFRASFKQEMENV